MKVPTGSDPRTPAARLFALGVAALLSCVVTACANPTSSLSRVAVMATAASSSATAPATTYSYPTDFQIQQAQASTQPAVSRDQIIFEQTQSLKPGETLAAIELGYVAAPVSRIRTPTSLRRSSGSSRSRAGRCRGRVRVRTRHAAPAARSRCSFLMSNSGSTTRRPTRWTKVMRFKFHPDSRVRPPRPNGAHPSHRQEY